jgi:hypothetical protein
MQVSLSSPDFNVTLDTANLGAFLNDAQKAQLNNIQHSNYSPEVIQALTNQLVMEAVNGALGDLKNAQPPLPEFLAKDITAQIEATLPKGNVDQGQLASAQKQFAPALNSIADSARQSLVNEVKSELQEEGRASSGSWLQAIAKALGKLAGEKAAKMVQLSDATARLTGTGGAGPAGGVPGGEKTQEQTNTDASNAQQSQLLLAENQATSQEFKLITETLNNLLKTLGEAMQSMARK